MTYFSKRNSYAIEYSGHEEISLSLRNRIQQVIQKNVQRNVSFGVDDAWFVEPSDFQHAVRQEFPSSDPSYLLEHGEFHEVFTIVEVFLDLTEELEYSRRESARQEMGYCFAASGSVYSIVNNRISLNLEPDLAQKIEEAKPILNPYETWYKTFFEAVGNLVGRRAKAPDIVKDIFVATEGYLKEKTGKTRFSEAVNHLHTQGVVNREQKAILEKLYAYRSDAAGAGHAGNSAEPSEVDALWYLETTLAQLRNVHRKLS